MEKIIKFGIAFFLLLTLVACDKAEENIEPEKMKEEVSEIVGKTFYNVNERFGNLSHSTVWFKKDNSFVIVDNFLEGTYEIYGTYEVKGNVCTLSVEKTTADEFDKIIFEIGDDDTVTLKTYLLGSISGDIFTFENDCTEQKDTDIIGIYYNAGQNLRNSFGTSCIEFKEDGTFIFTEVEGMGAVLVNGLYGREGDVLMLSNFDYALCNRYGADVFNIEFFIRDDGLLINEDITGTFKNDIFTKDGKAPKSWLDERFVDAHYIHETIQNVGNTYLPELILSSDGYFRYIENCYADMFSYYGIYTKDKNHFYCYVNDNSELQGFTGEDVWEIIFDIEGDNLILRTNLCMSQDGDVLFSSIR